LKKQLSEVEELKRKIGERDDLKTSPSAEVEELKRKIGERDDLKKQLSEIGEVEREQDNLKKQLSEVEELKRKIGDVERERDDLKKQLSEVEELKRKIGEQDNLKTTPSAEVEELRRKIGDVERERDDLKKQLQNTNEQKSKYEKVISENQKIVDKLKNEEEEKRKLEDKLKESDGLIVSCKDTSQKLAMCSKQIEELSHEREKLVSSSSESQRIKEELIKKIDEFNKLSDEQKSNIQKLREEEKMRENLEKELQKLREDSGKLEKYSGDLLTLELSLKEVQKEKDQLKESLNVASKDKDELEKTKREYQLAANEINTLKKQVEELEKIKMEKSTCREQIQDLEKTMKRSEEEKSEVTSKLDEERNKLKTEIESREGIIRELNQRIESLGKEGDTKRKELEERETKFRNLNDNLQTSISDLQEQVKVLLNEKKTCESEIVSLKDAVKKGMEEVGVLKKSEENLEKLKGELEEKEFKIKQLMEGEKLIEQKYIKKIESLEGELGNIQTLSESVKNELSNLQGENNKLQQQSSDLTEQINVCSASKGDIQKKLEEKESQLGELLKRETELAQKLNTMTKLESDLSTCSDTSAKLNLVIDELNNKMQLSKDTIAILEKEIQDNSSIFVKKESDMKAKLDELDRTQKELEKLKEEYNQINQSCKDDSVLLEKLKNERTDDSQKISKLIDEIEKLKGDLELKNVEIGSLKTEIEMHKTSRGEKEALEEELKKIKTQLEERGKDRENLQTEGKKLEEKIAKLEEDLQKYKEDSSQKERVSKERDECLVNLDKIQKETERVANAENSLKEDKTKLLSQINELKGVVDSSAKKVSTLEEELLLERSQLKKLQEEKNLSDTKIKEVEKELATLRNQLESVEKGNSEESGKNGELTKQIEELMKEKTTLEGSLEKRESEIGELRDKISRLQKGCDADIAKLKSEIERTLQLLDESKKTKIVESFDWANCNKNLETYKSIIETINRKGDIVKRIEGILDKSEYYSNLGSTERESIRNDFNKIKGFLEEKVKTFNIPQLEADLKRNPNLSGGSKANESLCINLDNLFKSWNNELEIFKDLDTKLTNLFEDILGSVRVYVRIRRINGSEIISRREDDIKSLDITCDAGTRRFGPFYGIFTGKDSTDDVYNNMEYGISNSIGQLRSGYNVVIFGYGISGSGKCLGRGTEVLMYDGSIKRVEDISVGELVMGDDSTPRRVLSLARGKDTMYQVTNSKGDRYIVNSEHILSLIDSQKDIKVDISIRDYLELPRKKRNKLVGYKVGVEFEEREIDIDPYLLGMSLYRGPISPIYKTNSRTIRLNLLGGLVDKWGMINGRKLRLVIPCEHLQMDVQFLARSLGFNCYTRKGFFCGKSYLTLNGDLQSIPSIRFNRFFAHVPLPGLYTKQLQSPIKIRPLGTDDYFGFMLDGNHRFVLGNFLVTHNSHTLLGSKNSPGILELGLRDLISSGASVSLKYAFEQYYSTISLAFKKVSGSVIPLYPKRFPRFINDKFFEKVDNSGPFEEALSKRGVNVSQFTPDLVNNFVEVCDGFRIERHRIKSTPNNPQSSRSHLFLTFEVKLGGNTSYLTIVDTAGKESPLGIYKSFMKDKGKVDIVTFIQGGEKLIKDSDIMDKLNIMDSPYIQQSSSKYAPKHILEVIKEGVYINETVNHLTWYLNNKSAFGKVQMRIPRQGANYSPENVYIDPVTESTGEPSGNEGILTIPILNFLDKLGRGGGNTKPTKFIMICNVRQEPQYCEQTVSTLNFANKIKST
jgi:chromosome segregation ATPase